MPKGTPQPYQKGTEGYKGWGKGGGKSLPFDKGKGKGYGSMNPWSSYSPAQSKGTGKDQWVSQKGYAKGGKGTYNMEQEWFPDPNWYASWEEPKEPEYQPLFNQGLQDPTREPSGWEVPPPRRTFKPSPFPVQATPWLTGIHGRFEALSSDDPFQHRIKMLTPEEE